MKIRKKKRRVAGKGKNSKRRNTSLWPFEDSQKCSVLSFVSCVEKNVQPRRARKGDDVVFALLV